MQKLKHLFAFSVCLFAMILMAGAQSYQLPSYTRFVLKNGLTVYLMEQHEVPTISVTAVVPAGAIYDGDQSGIASLTASALLHGTKSFSKKQLDEILDFAGASLNTYSSKEFAGLASKFSVKDQDQIFKIIYEALASPTFPADEFEKEKKRLLTGLEQQKERPRSVISNYFNKLIYGNHVYGNAVQGYPSSVAKINVAEVQKFYQENFRPNGSAISIVGDFNTKQMKAKITAFFSSWKKGKEPKGNLAANAIPAPQESKVMLVNKEDAKETTFLIGSLGVSRNNPDYVAIDVVNTLFGGRFTSMLNDELRVNSGLTYGASSRFSNLKNGGSFYISTFTALPTTEAAIDKSLEVLNKLHENGLDETSLASAKNYVKGQFPPNYETSSQLAELLSEMFWYGFDESFINNFEKNVDGLDLIKANQIIKKYFPKDKLQFVLIGKAEAIKKIAEKYGKVTVVDIKEDPKKGF